MKYLVSLMVLVSVSFISFLAFSAAPGCFLFPWLVLVPAFVEPFFYCLGVGFSVCSLILWKRTPKRHIGKRWSSPRCEVGFLWKFKIISNVQCFLWNGEPRVDFFMMLPGRHSLSVAGARRASPPCSAWSPASLPNFFSACTPTPISPVQFPRKSRPLLCQCGEKEGIRLLVTWEESSFQTGQPATLTFAQV